MPFSFGNSRKLIAAVFILVLVCANTVFAISAKSDGSAVDDVRSGDGRSLPAVVSAADITENPGSVAASGTDAATEPVQPSSDVVFTAADVESITAFYSEAAFVGDSVLQGFHNHIQAKKDTPFAKSVFLASYSFSSHTNSTAIKEDSKHPYYKGQRRKVQDSLALSGAKRVFICLWANEILLTDYHPTGNLPQTYTDYNRMVERIREKNPDIEIIVVSPHYMWKNSQNDYMNNVNFDALRIMFADIAEKNDARYLDIGRFLGNAEDGMYQSYAHDMYVHMTGDAYDVWMRVLMDYALGRDTDYESVAYPGDIVLKADIPESSHEGVAPAYDISRAGAGNGVVGAEKAAEIIRTA